MKWLLRPRFHCFDLMKTSHVVLIPQARQYKLYQVRRKYAGHSTQSKTLLDCTICKFIDIIKDNRTWVNRRDYCCLFICSCWSYITLLELYTVYDRWLRNKKNSKRTLNLSRMCATSLRMKPGQWNSAVFVWVSRWVLLVLFAGGPDNLWRCKT